MGQSRPFSPRAADRVEDLRAHPREATMRRGVVVHHTTGHSYNCVIVDVSLGGARLQLYAPDLPDRDLTLIDAAMGMVHELRIAWRNADFVGVAFEASVDLAAAAEAALEPAADFGG